MTIIHSYLVDLYGDASSDGVRARIDLVGERALVGTLRFYDEGTPQPPDATAGACVQVHLPMAAFAGALALLQHDRPVEIELDRGRGRLFTREREGVGEGREPG